MATIAFPLTSSLSHLATPGGNCSICQASSKFACRNCLKVNYCSAEHQITDWKWPDANISHRRNCFPLIVSEDEFHGRRLLATRNIAAGEIFLRENPIVQGPNNFELGLAQRQGTKIWEDHDQSSKYLCLTCNHIVRSDYVCSKCNWPLCSRECEMNEIHAGAECEIFARRFIPPFNLIQGRTYEIIGILRALLLSEAPNQAKWNNLRKLPVNLGGRSTSPSAHLVLDDAIDFIRDTCNLKEVFDEGMIREVTGRMQSSGIYSGDLYIRGTNTSSYGRYGSYVYAIGSLAAHSCFPNTLRIIRMNSSIAMKAIVDIKCGDPITTSFIPLYQTTQERRAFLEKIYYFSCNCPRCSDPTELGSFFSAHKCQSTLCHKEAHYLVPCDPLSSNSDWKCSFCGAVKTKEMVAATLADIQSELDAVDGKFSQENLDKLELILTHHSDVSVHENHGMMWKVEMQIIQRLDYMLRHGIKVVPNILALNSARQIELVRKWLRVSDLFYPGCHLERGRLNYYLQSGLTRCAIDKVDRNFNLEDHSSKAQVKLVYEEIMQTRREAACILSIVPGGRSESAVDVKTEMDATMEQQAIARLSDYFTMDV